MKVTPELIDEVLEWMSELSDDELQDLVDNVSETFPNVFNYVTSPDFAEEGEEEHEMMIYLFMVVCETMKKAFPKLKDIEREEILHQAEEAIWQQIEKLEPWTEQELDEYLEPIVGNHKHQELLYMIIDITEEESGDDEFAISQESQLPIFVGLKAVIDAWTAKGFV